VKFCTFLFYYTTASGVTDQCYLIDGVWNCCLLRHIQGCIYQRTLLVLQAPCTGLSARGRGTAQSVFSQTPVIDWTTLIIQLEIILTHTPLQDDRAKSTRHLLTKVYNNGRLTSRLAVYPSHNLINDQIVPFYGRIGWTLVTQIPNVPIVLLLIHVADNLSPLWRLVSLCFVKTGADVEWIKQPGTTVNIWQRLVPW